MSESQDPGSRFSPWWALLLLPIGLAIGWHVGGRPVAAKKLEVVAAPAARTLAPEPVRVTPRRRSSFGDDVAEPPRDAASRAEKPKPEEPTVISEWTTLENAMDEAKRNGKPVLLDFNADWCGPCQVMKKHVFQDAVLGLAIQSAVIPVSIVDRRRENGSNPPAIDNLLERFEVDAFPTLVVFSVETGRIQKTRGFRGADETAAWIAEAAKSVR